MLSHPLCRRMRQRRLQKHFGSWKVVANDKAHDIIMAKVMMMNYRRSAIASKFYRWRAATESQKLRASREAKNQQMLGSARLLLQSMQRMLHRDTARAFRRWSVETLRSSARKSHAAAETARSAASRWLISALSAVGSAHLRQYFNQWRLFAAAQHGHDEAKNQSSHIIYLCARRAPGTLPCVAESHGEKKGEPPRALSLARNAHAAHFPRICKAQKVWSSIIQKMHPVVERDAWQLGTHIGGVSSSRALAAYLAHNDGTQQPFELCCTRITQKLLRSKR